jgi:F-type H+-transporting ATPase subunit a
MEENGVHSQELPTIIRSLAERFPHNPFFEYLLPWENVIYSILVAGIILLFAFFATRNTRKIPDRMQNFAELIVEGIDDFVCAIIGPNGREFTPFIGTLFIYIFCLNLVGLIPFLKSPTANLSTTFALGICVFFYVQIIAVKKLGFIGYLDHLSGGLRGPLALTVILPVFMLVLHIITEFFRPISLALRLRGNIWGDEMLLGVLAHFGLPGLPLLFFNTLMSVLAGVMQAVVFTLLSTVYIALVMPHSYEENNEKH